MLRNCRSVKRFSFVSVRGCCAKDTRWKIASGMRGGVRWNITFPCDVTTAYVILLYFPWKFVFASLGREPGPPESLDPGLCLNFRFDENNATAVPTEISSIRSKHWKIVKSAPVFLDEEEGNRTFPRDRGFTYETTIPDSFCRARIKSIATSEKFRRERVIIRSGNSIVALRTLLNDQMIVNSRFLRFLTT